MKVGIFCFDRFGEYFYDTYTHILKKNNIDFVKLDPNLPCFFSKIEEVSHIVFRWIHVDDHHQIAKTLLPVLEREMEKKCFPNQSTCWHYDDKAMQYFLLKSHGFPVIDTKIFWNKYRALSWAHSTSYPQVFKLTKGAGSFNVVLVKSLKSAKRIIKAMFSKKGIRFFWIPSGGLLQFHPTQWVKTLKIILRQTLLYNTSKGLNEHWGINKNYVLFQKFLPNNTSDTRITVIGRRAFGYVRKVRKNDFRASGSGDFYTDPKKIDLRCVELALEISEKLKFQSMAYDFVFNEQGEPEICEISYTYVDWMVHSCPGYWDKDLKWYEGHYWPQYCHLVDLLDSNDLVQPDLSQFN